MNFLWHRLERGSPDIHRVRIVWAKMLSRVLISVGGYKQCCAMLYGMAWATALIHVHKFHEFVYVTSTMPMLATKVFFHPQENPPSTRQKDYVRINALKTSSPRTVWALCRCYWGGPQQVLNKDCWWEMWSHPWCNLHIDNAPIWQDREKESGLTSR